MMPGDLLRAKVCTMEFQLSHPAPEVLSHAGSEGPTPEDQRP